LDSIAYVVQLVLTALIGLTVTALWQLYARENVWIANAIWIASRDKKRKRKRK